VPPNGQSSHGISLFASREVDPRIVALIKLSEPPSSDGAQKVQQVVEWRPSRSEAIAWTWVGIAVTVFGLALFALPSMFRAGRIGGSVRIGLLDVLVVVGLVSILVIAHEAIHGIVMLGFGARPRFGATLVGRVVPAVYATAPGHRFTRNQYLAVAAAPAVVITSLGMGACFSPWAAYLILPLALHLGGCVGDGFAAWRVLREPAGTEFEDLQDGIRFYRTSAIGPGLKESPGT
jgi:hypothetical protein